MIFMGQDIITLSDLQLRLKEGVERVFPQAVWVKVEVNSIKSRPGGHCYMDVCETGPQGDVIAKAQAIIWSSRYRILAPYFLKLTGHSIEAGMELFIRVRVNYSELYGLSLIVDDINAEVTVGQQELIRQQTIARLKSEGVLDLQKELEIPSLPYDIAVISAENAAGYRDFMRHLHENEFGFEYRTTLYSATMQGKDAPSSIMEAIDAAVQRGHDVIAILRGGGSNHDLSCFDNYDIASYIANCPIPVMTALGHDQDYHICDMVAHTHVKTPTALADWFLSVYEDEDAMLQSYVSRLKMAFSGKIALMESKLQNLETRIKSADPRNVLSKGYALVVGNNGTVVKKASAVNVGKPMSIMFADGTVHCIVESVDISPSAK